MTSSAITTVGRRSRLERRVKCPQCGAIRMVNLSCDDCKYSFTNPFDQRFCEKGKTATRVCKQFSPRSEENQKGGAA